MARRVFYSFHYDPDSWRASQIRNMGLIAGERPAVDNDWEQVRRGNDAAIERWIAKQFEGTSCCVVLIGAETAGRKWISYEIAQAWNLKKGVLGIHVHNLKDRAERQSAKGRTPFDYVTHNASGKPLSSIVQCYDPPSGDSRQVYAHIQASLDRWIQEACILRNMY